jgi:uncharacterized protein YeaO (DUF488 family)
MYTFNEEMESKGPRIKRIYEPASGTDGKRILVDRLWPRGISKGRAAVDEWIREIAPSSDLRKWFAHDPSKWDEFKKKYRKELLKNMDLVTRLKAETRKGPVTLLYAAKDPEHNNAVVLKEFLDE